MSLNDVLQQERDEEMEVLRELSLNLKEIAEPYEVITLQEFETYLLPYIIKEIEHTDENTAIFNSNFLNLSKKYRVGLKVMDGDKLLYKLPPLISSLKTDENKINFRKIVNTFNNTVESNPRMANSQLNKNLNIVEKTLKEDKSYINDFRDTLSKIYNDYSHRVKSNKTVTETKDEIEDDFLDY